jgi:hypothetical protein
VRFILSLLFLLHSLVSCADPSSPQIKVDLFLSSTCSHCHKVDIFFQALEKNKPWLTVHRHIINKDKKALQLFYQRLRQYNSVNFSVPSIFFCDSHWIGFSEANTTGETILKGLSYCRQKIMEQKGLTKSTINVLQKWGAATQFQLDKKARRSIFSSVITTAFTDALSPCSLFLFSLLLVFLWSYPHYQLKVGGIFLLALGMVHYLQAVHSAFYYQITPRLRLFEALVGGAWLWILFNIYRQKTPKQAAKLKSYHWIVIPLLVFAVYVYQQTCIFNAPLVLEQWLDEQSLVPANYLFYQVSYQVFYLLPFVLFLFLYVFLAKKEFLKRYEDQLKKAGYFISISMSMILIIYPDLLSSLAVSIVILLISLVFGWLFRKRSV